MENSTSTITQEIHYLETLSNFNIIETKLVECFKKLCEIGSQIGNIYTILNDMNKCIFFYSKE